MESSWSHGRPAYRCRHGRTTGPEEVISCLREQQVMLTYNQATGTLHAGAAKAAATITLKAS